MAQFADRARRAAAGPLRGGAGAGDRLKAAATRAERSRIFATMYTELFAQVRITAAHGAARSSRRGARVQRLLGLLRPHLHPGLEYVEFGAGAGALALAVCPYVKRRERGDRRSDPAERHAPCQLRARAVRRVRDGIEPVR